MRQTFLPLGAFLAPCFAVGGSRSTVSNPMAQLLLPRLNVTTEISGKYSVSVRDEVHTAFIQVYNGDLAMVDKFPFPPLSETEVFKGPVNFNKSKVLGCVIALQKHR